MAITLTAKQKQRLDTASNWSSANPTLLSGEIGYESDTGKTKVGDGSTAWSSLAYTTFGGLPKTGGTMTGAILGDDSTSASTPGYAFDGDANTGLLRTGADAVALVTGGTAAVSVDSSQNVILAANLTVNGTTTTIDTQNLDVEDKNITIGKVSTPSDTTADGGGITLKGASDKTITWTDSTDSWDFNQHVNIATGTEFKINNASVLSATALGASVVGSSLTSVGTIASGTWQGTAIGSSYMTAGTTSAVGAVQLEDSTTSTSTTKAATPASVKVAKDAADAAATTANAALPKAGGDMTGNLVLDNDKEVRFNEADSNGSAYVGIKGASDKSSEASYTISLPAAAPAVNQVLKAGSSTATDLVWSADNATDSTKMPLAGGSFTGDVVFTGDAANVTWDKSADDLIFNDNAKAVFGTSSDGLEIYHSGSHSYIKDTGTGDLFICSDDLHIGNAANTEDMAVFKENGAVELYYDNVKTCQTITDGIRVEGTEGSHGKLEIFADEGDDDADKWQFLAHTGGAFQLQNFTSGSWENNISATGNGSVELMYDNAKKFETTSSGVQLSGTNHQILGDFWFNNDTNGGNDLKWDESADSLIFYDSVKAAFGVDSDLLIFHNGTDSYLKNSTGKLILEAKDGEDAITINPDGAVELYFDDTKHFSTHTDGVTVLGEEGGHARLELFADEGDDDADKWQIVANTDGSLYLQNLTSGAAENNLKATGNAGVILYFDNSAKVETVTGGCNITGDLTATGNVTAYSDERLKTDIKTIDNAVDIVNNLRGVTYTRKDTNEKGVGVIAQEIEDVLPQVVQDGEYKSVAYGNIVGVLIEAVKELKAEIEELKGG